MVCSMGKRKRQRNKVSKEKPQTDLEMLEEVKSMIYKKLKKGECQVKVGDLVKVVELQRRLSADAGSEKQFWEFIEQLRQEELKDE